MKRIYIIMALAAMVAVACEKDPKPQDRPIDPSEINTDNKDEESTWQYDSFMGYDMPHFDEHRQEMEATLCKIDSQEGEIDDELSGIRMEIESLEPDLEPAQAKNDPLNDPQAPADRAGSRALLVRIAEKRLRQRRSEAIQ